MGAAGWEGEERSRGRRSFVPDFAASRAWKLGSQANIAQGRMKRMERREKGGGQGRGGIQSLCVWLVSAWPNPHSRHPGLAFRHRSLIVPCPQPALISSRHPRLAKAAAHQGLVLLPFAHTFDQTVPSTKGTARKLFLRAAWDFLEWLQRSESNLQLLCRRPRGPGRECFSWRGSSLGPGTVWPPHKSLESPPGWWGGGVQRPLCARQAVCCCRASSRSGKWGLGRLVLNDPQGIGQMDSPGGAVL